MLDLLLPFLLSAAPALPPIVSPAAGSYSGTTTITVKPRTGGSLIRCTTDGTDPDASSARAAPVQVMTLVTSATVRCRAWARRRAPSAIVEQTYTIADGYAVTPAVGSVAPGESVTFTTEPFMAAATWTTTAGSITAAGVYTAPACNSPAREAVVVATVNDAKATGALRVQDRVTAVEITPGTAEVQVNGTVAFSALVRTVCLPNGITQPAIFQAPPGQFGGATSFAAAIRPQPKKRGKP